MTCWRLPLQRFGAHRDAPRQDVGEAVLRQSAEERVRAEARGSEGRAAEAAQEAGLLTTGGQGVWIIVAQCRIVHRAGDAFAIALEVDSDVGRVQPVPGAAFLC